MLLLAEAGSGGHIHVAELDYGPQNCASSSSALAPHPAERFQLVVGSDVIFSETHAALATALAMLIADDGQCVLCLADKRVGTEGFLKGCEREALTVRIVPITAEMLSVAQEETGDDELGTERPHSLYFIRHAEW